MTGKAFLVSAFISSSSMVAVGQQATSFKISAIPHELSAENSPLKVSTSNNGILIVAGPKTDMFRDPNLAYNTDNAPKLVFKPDENFVISTAIEHRFLNKWDGGAIVLRQDSVNWIKFCFEKDYTGAHRVVSVVTKNLSDDCNSVEIKATKVYYKMAKADNVITLYYSTEGSKWFLIRHLQFDSGQGLVLGFLAQSPTGSRCEVRFSDIHYYRKKIKDPYAGE